MATSSRLTLYGSSLQNLSRRFSTQNSFKPASATFVDVNAEKDKAAAPKLTFTLPGNTTTADHYLSWKNPFPSVKTQGVGQTDVFTCKLYQQDQCDTVHQVGRMDAKENAIEPPKNSQLEFMALDCPTLVKKDFADLFPNRNIQEGSFTVMNLTQKTENDMISWNEDMEAEREQLTVQFIESASQICAALKEAGFWADFIDPSSGRPYLGPFTNATLFETDERLRNFGLSIEDLGCCKVIKHAIWGTHAFVGNLFTNAPLDSPAMQEIMAKMNQD